MNELVLQITNGSFKALSRAITIVENKVEGYEEILLNLPTNHHTTIIGITGPPGAGKSTVADALIGEMIAADKSVGVLCIDPSSPFNLGALLGDRIRMNKWYANESVFIRSLASRGSLGGLHPAIIEITDTMNAFGFDYILVETVGVGQSEVEIAGLADITVIVLVPESGDEVQTMKAGLMEIGDVFVVNKADRPGADAFEKSLRNIFRSSSTHFDTSIIKTIASENAGIKTLFETLIHQKEHGKWTDKQVWLLAEKAHQLISAKRMADLNKESIYILLRQRLHDQKNLNLYRFIEEMAQDRT